MCYKIKLIIERKIKRKGRASNNSFLCIIIKGEESIFIGIEDNPKGTTQGLDT